MSSMTNMNHCVCSMGQIWEDFNNFTFQKENLCIVSKTVSGLLFAHRKRCNKKINLGSGSQKRPVPNTTAISPQKDREHAYESYSHVWHHGK